VRLGGEGTIESTVHFSLAVIGGSPGLYLIAKASADRRSPPSTECFVRLGGEGTRKSTVHFSLAVIGSSPGLYLIAFDDSCRPGTRPHLKWYYL